MIDKKRSTLISICLAVSLMVLSLGCSDKAYIDRGRNNAPVGAEDNITTREDTNITIDLLANDSDKENDSLTITNLTQPTNGSATVKDNKVLYSPDANYNGEDSFTYKPYDGIAYGATVTVNVKVTPVNDAGSIADINGTAKQGEKLRAGAISDIDGYNNDALYQWQESDEANGIYTDILGATSSTYTLTHAKAGKYIKVEATYTDAQGSLESVTSNATAKVIPILPLGITINNDNITRFMV